MNARTLKDKLIKGETVYGTLFQHAVTPSMVDFLPPNALDFVIVTAEHNALGLSDFLPVRYALASKGIACLARTHSRDPAGVAKVCVSFDGVVVPYVEDVEHAKRLAAAAVYRPLKGEVLERVIEKGQWPNKKTEDFVERRNADTVFIPMIESVPAVENIDAICSIPGVHAVFVGPGDLTTNM
jgi:2-keto-3-deoxy-L-rhamnonate aldolase RhmA